MKAYKIWYQGVVDYAMTIHAEDEAQAKAIVEELLSLQDIESVFDSQFHDRYNFNRIEEE